LEEREQHVAACLEERNRSHHAELAGAEAAADAWRRTCDAQRRAFRVHAKSEASQAASCAVDFRIREEQHSAVEAVAQARREEAEAHGKLQRLQQQVGQFHQAQELQHGRAEMYRDELCSAESEAARQGEELRQIVGHEERAQRELHAMRQNAQLLEAQQDDQVFHYHGELELSEAAAKQHSAEIKELVGQRATCLRELSMEEEASRSRLRCQEELEVHIQGYCCELRSAGEAAAWQHHLTQETSCARLQAENRCRAVEQQLSQVQQASQEITDHAAGYCDELRCAQSVLARLRAELDDASRAHKLLQDEFQSMQTQALDAESARHESVASANRYRQELHHVEEAAACQAVPMRAQFEEVLVEVKKLEHENTNRMTECESLHSELSGRLTEIAQVNKNLDEAQQQCKSSEWLTARLRDEIVQKDHNAECVARDLLNEQSEVAALRSQLRDLFGRLSPSACSVFDGTVFPQVDKTKEVSLEASCKLREAMASSALAKPNSLGGHLLELDAFRHELRNAKGGEPLSDVTGAWQCVRSLEHRAVLGQSRDVESQDMANLPPPPCWSPGRRSRLSWGRCSVLSATAFGSVEPMVKTRTESQFSDGSGEQDQDLVLSSNHTSLTALSVATGTPRRPSTSSHGTLDCGTPRKGAVSLAIETCRGVHAQRVESAASDRGSNSPNSEDGTKILRSVLGARSSDGSGGTRTVASGLGLHDNESLPTPPDAARQCHRRSGSGAAGKTGAVSPVRSPVRGLRL